MTRVAVIGSAGQLGSDLVPVLQAEGYEVFGLGHADVECADFDSVRSTLAAIHPDVVVNCASFVRVDECEDQLQEAFRINAIGALNVARSCTQLNALCVYVSTDYVFDGEKREPYTEEDPPCPINVYGASKLAGENLVSQGSPRWLIVRMASLFGKAGARGKGGNFVETILAKARSGESLRVVNDIRMSPTYTHDASRALERLVRQGATGLFHVTNTSSCTWYEFSREILDLAGVNGLLEPVSSKDYPSQARRPRNSSLQSTRLDAFVKEHLRPWREALKAYFIEKGYWPGEALASSHRLPE